MKPREVIIAVAMALSTHGAMAPEGQADPGASPAATSLAISFRRPLVRAVTSTPVEEHIEPVRDWVAESWDEAEERQLYQVRSSPGAAISYWLTSNLNRFLAKFSEDGRGPLPGMAGFGVLRVEPVAGVPSSGYGYRRHPITGGRKFHKGVDYRADRGTEVRAAGPGLVTYAKTKGSYGQLVVISHGMGLETRYAHLHRIHVEEGEFVQAGARIGQVGSTGRSTGPHLHFEVRQFEEAINPHWALGVTDSTLLEDMTAVVTWLTSEE